MSHDNTGRQITIRFTITQAQYPEWIGGNHLGTTNDNLGIKITAIQEGDLFKEHDEAIEAMQSGSKTKVEDWLDANGY